MYAAIRRYRMDPQRVGEVLQRAREGFGPLFEAAPGFRAYQLVNAGGGQVVSVALFDDQAGAEAAHARIGAWARANMAEYLAGPSDAIDGEVVLHGAK